MKEYTQIAPAHRRAQVALRCAGPPALVDRELDLGKAVGLFAADVVVGLLAERLRRRDHRWIERVAVGVRARDGERTGTAVPGGFAAPVRLRAFEVLQHVGMRPAM